MIRNARLLGGIALADRSEALVIGRHSPAEPGSATFSVDDPAEVRSLSRRQDIGALLHGVDEDGCLWFLNLFTTPRHVTTQQRSSG